MKNIIFVITLFFIQVLSAQNENNIWYFGQNAGIDFNGCSPIALTNGALNTFEGCATISDSVGNLLFYSDGTKIWNRNHVVMPNGNNLEGDLSSTQAAAIIKKPGVNKIYYVFTTDDTFGSNGLKYSEVDMSLDNGMGDVNSLKNIPLVSSSDEKISIIRHSNNIDYWIVTHIYWQNNEFHSYLLTSSGISSTPVISNVGTVHTKYAGYMKASPDGKRLALAFGDFGIAELFDFNNLTGTVSNPITFTNFNLWGAYGVEFSPNSNLLYISESSYPISNIYQYNLLAGSAFDIINSRTIIGSDTNSTQQGGGAIQLGPDRKIYHARAGKTSLGIINNPNSVGLLSNYVSNGISLAGKISWLGLPNFSNSTSSTSFNFDKLCSNDSISFSINALCIDSVIWNFGDQMSGSNNTSNLLQPKHLFQNDSNYLVTLIIFTNGDSDTVTNWLSINPSPVVNMGDDTLLCDEEILIFDVTTPSASYLWQDNSTNPTFTATQQGTYWVKVTVNNCTTTDTILINREDCDITLEMPNVFTPNNDGINDLFVPKISKGIVSMNTLIYNRWGKKIYETDNLFVEWSGQDVSDGAYFWIIYYTDKNGDENSLKGVTSLLR